MHGKMKLGAKLMLAFLAVGVIPLVIMGIISLVKASEGLSKQAFSMLESTRDIKRSETEKFFLQRRQDMDVLVDTVQAMRNAAFEKLETVQELKKAQIEGFFARLHADILALARSEDVNNMYRQVRQYHDAMHAGSDALLDTSTPDYETIHETYGEYLTQFVKTQGYYDLYIICATHGHILFSVEKGPDLGTNLGKGPYRNEGLARLWKKVVNTKDVVFEDFSDYTPNNGRQTAFIGGPIYDRSGSLLGVIALQIPSAPINMIVQRREGMGKSGETFLVGKVHGLTTLRSDITTIGNGKYVIGYETTTPYIEKALSGVRAREVQTDSAGNLVMVAYDPLIVDGLDWACISKMNIEEAIAPKQPGREKDYFTEYVEKYGYYDLFMIHPDGKVFYSVAHEADYGTNMVNGKYSDSGLGVLVKKVLQDRRFGIADFSPYSPSNNEPAAFIAEPIVDHGEVQLIVALQLSLGSINAILQERSGMGRTGETYLVGPDKLMRSDSLLNPASHSVKASFANPSEGSVETEAGRDALAGKAGEKITTDYRGKRVLSAYTPVKVGDFVWALIAEIEETEAFATVKSLEYLLGILIAGGIAAIVALALFITRSISLPVNRVVEGLNHGACQVAAASEQISSSVQQLAEGASQQAASLEETSASMEEIAAMTRQNAENCSHADRLMKEANQMIASSNGSMIELHASMEAISKAGESTFKIVKSIDEIAFRTNLLALNAAVEAARAGEAGLGFAVVAEEVRSLAMSAAQAAGNTAELIQGTIKRVSEGSEAVTTTSKAFAGVTLLMARVGELVGEIAVASDEQTRGIELLNTAMAEMDKVVQQNAAGAEESASVSEEMNSQAERMMGFVDELVGLTNGTAPAQGIRDGEPTADYTKESITRTQKAEGPEALIQPVKKADGKVVVLHRGRKIIPHQAISSNSSDIALKEVRLSSQHTRHPKNLIMAKM